MKNEKVAVIGFANLHLMPYMNKYIKILEDENIEYDIIFWDRENKHEKGDNLFPFVKVIDSALPVTTKLLSFFQYSKFIKKILKQNKYNKIIVLYTITGIIIKNYLRKYYKNNYILAYTDYTFEKFNPYKKALAQLVNNSAFTTITSLGFNRYLPHDSKLVISHNIDKFLKSKYSVEIDISLPIKITYAGIVRDFDNIKSTINLFKDDTRFQLDYYGSGFCLDELREYITQNNITNVFVHGEFSPENKQDIINTADIINNAFSNDLFQKYAMTNRMYDALYNKKAQIVTKDSYSDEIIRKYDIGYSIDLADKEIADNLYNWYINLDAKKFNDNCDKYVKIIKNDVIVLDEKIRSFLEINNETK